MAPRIGAATPRVGAGHAPRRGHAQCFSEFALEGAALALGAGWHVGASWRVCRARHDYLQHRHQHLREKPPVAGGLVVAARSPETRGGARHGGLQRCAQRCEESVVVVHGHCFAEERAGHSHGAGFDHLQRRDRCRTRQPAVETCVGVIRRNAADAHRRGRVHVQYRRGRTWSGATLRARGGLACGDAAYGHGAAHCLAYGCHRPHGPRLAACVGRTSIVDCRERGT
mmetsp:Transcript_112820/g.319026  ORF Transcript_112820/g.319026 Transcript_112820/m.319026 type:complete len:227 (-) Transcript_112820:1051-1731(-)